MPVMLISRIFDVTSPGPPRAAGRYRKALLSLDQEHAHQISYAEADTGLLKKIRQVPLPGWRSLRLELDHLIEANFTAVHSRESGI